MGNKTVLNTIYISEADLEDLIMKGSCMISDDCMSIKIARMPVFEDDSKKERSIRCRKERLSK